MGIPPPPPTYQNLPNNERIKRMRLTDPSSSSSSSPSTTRVIEQSPRCANSVNFEKCVDQRSAAIKAWLINCAREEKIDMAKSYVKSEGGLLKVVNLPFDNWAQYDFRGFYESLLLW